MREHIEQLTSQVHLLIQNKLALNHLDFVRDLSGVHARLKNLLKRAEDVELEISSLKPALSRLGCVVQDPPNGGRARSPGESETPGQAGWKTLRITVDWHANGVNRVEETICEFTSAASLVAFLGRLLDEFGHSALSPMTAIRMHNGPLLSRSPATDFTDPSTGRLLSHKSLRGTGYWVLTHGSTATKLDAIARVAERLLPAPGSVRCDELDTMEVCW